jgi:hypothetical protein
MLEKRGAYRFWWGNLWKSIDIMSWIILKWILQKLVGRAWTALLWLRLGTGGDFF